MAAVSRVGATPEVNPRIQVEHTITEMTVFGFFDLKDDEDEEKYEKAYRYYKSIYENVFKCKTF